MEIKRVIEHIMKSVNVLLNRLVALLPHKDEGNLIGNEFDILPEKERNVVCRGARIISPGNANASITWNGAIRLFPTPQWNDMTLVSMLRLIVHEAIHIAVGQLVGSFASCKYDNLVRDNMTLIIKYHEKTDLFARTDNEAITLIAPPTRFWEGEFGENNVEDVGKLGGVANGELSAYK